MSNPPPPPSLAALLARAEDFAPFSMRSGGKVPPTLLADTPGGPLFFLPSSLRDERAKDNFATIARLICIAHAATVAVMVLEAWMKLAAPDGTLDLSVPPSESLHRKEVVMLTGESRAGFKQKILPIIRTGAGGFFAFGEFDGPAATSFSGRFAQILPPKPPAPGDQARARTLLAALGVTAEALRRDWSAN
jgi:hypothetical protein